MMVNSKMHSALSKMHLLDPVRSIMVSLVFYLIEGQYIKLKLSRFCWKEFKDENNDLVEPTVNPYHHNLLKYDDLSPLTGPVFVQMALLGGTGKRE